MWQRKGDIIMDKTFYECYETDVISEITAYPVPLSLFVTGKIYEKLYTEELPRFQKNPINIYGLPFDEKPLKIYRGIGRMGIDKITDYMKLCKNNDDYELMFVRLSGSDDKIPDGYRFIGYDIAYPPKSDGGFSIICDCMFICRWHGCDYEGTEFTADFSVLNNNGLFSMWQDAYNYMVHYLNQEWSERGIFGIYEIYEKIP